jgi:hypothetical protein
MDNEIYICRFTHDIKLKKEECGNYKNGYCDVDDEECNSTEYVLKHKESKK